MTPEEELIFAVRTLARTGVDDAELGRIVRKMMTPPTSKVVETPDQRQVVALKVRFPGGVATNISLPRALLSAAAAVLGGEIGARKRARELARLAPNTNNRSGWVQDQLALVIKARRELPAGSEAESQPAKV